MAIQDVGSQIKSFFFVPDSQAKIDSIALDCATDESHAYTSTVTDYPQEDGFKVQDNVWLEPFKLTLKGIVSDTKLKLFGGGGALSGLQRHVDDVYDKLLALRAKRDVFEVMTGLKIYQNMVFTSLTIERDQETGGSFRIEAELKQIKKVQVKENINTDKTDNKSFPNNKNNGTQQADKEDDLTPEQKEIQNIDKRMGGKT